MCESPRRDLGLQEPQIASICTSAVAKLCTIWWRDQELCTWALLYSGERVPRWAKGEMGAVGHAARA